jgi:putative FmdB family regulatory protein
LTTALAIAEAVVVLGGSPGVLERARHGIILVEIEARSSQVPIYEYVCDDCGEHYERIVMSKNAAITCPKCESAKKTVQLSVFAAPANGSKSSERSGSRPTSGGGCGCTPHTCGCH